MKHLWTAIGDLQGVLGACNEIDRLYDMNPGGGEVTNRNRDFRAAQSGKKDEFYTSLKDIEAEIVHYRPHFAGKVVYCNCDDPRASNFFRYFAEHFDELGLKRLIATCYRSLDSSQFSKGESDHGLFLEHHGGLDVEADRVKVQQLRGDGDFRSDESVELLQQADIVVTNPPFSLFREYVSQLVEYDKKFIILGNLNAVTYQEVFDLFQQDRIWYGSSIRSGDREFRVPDDYPLKAAGARVDDDGNRYIRVKGVRWFTNLEYPGRQRPLQLVRAFDPHDYPKYANFDAIEVSRTKEIPYDYPGPMGVPITFLDWYDPDQFEILGSSKSLGVPMAAIAPKGSFLAGGPRFYLPKGDGTFRRMYDRIVIRNRHPQRSAVRTGKGRRGISVSR